MIPIMSPDISKLKKNCINLCKSNEREPVTFSE